jgi:prepilin-type processing-associated H-X9-DG protein
LIITLLMALALPALVHVRRAAYTTQCSSQMRQLAQAVTIYASDNNDALPPVGIRGPLPPAVTAPTGPLLENFATILVFNPAHSYIDAPTNTKRSSVFSCPSTGSEDEWSLKSQFFPNPTNKEMIIRTTYAMNGTDGNTAGDYKRFPNWVVPVNGAGANVIRDPKTLSTVPMPSRMVLFFEGLGYPRATAAIAGVDFKVSTPHGGQNQTNIVYYDSHVETLAKDDLPKGATTSTPEEAILDTTTATGQSPAQHPLEKVAMRWRMDVEPK